MEAGYGAGICRYYFYPSVKAAQTLYGSRAANRGFELAADARNCLSAWEADYIAARDSFYQATVGENGWPYVQHRGGPAGFVKVFDERTLGYADFRGNRQYISVGQFECERSHQLNFYGLCPAAPLKNMGACAAGA